MGTGGIVDMQECKLQRESKHNSIEDCMAEVQKADIQKGQSISQMSALQAKLKSLEKYLEVEREESATPWAGDKEDFGYREPFFRGISTMGSSCTGL